jgi:hypothetical protein
MPRIFRADGVDHDPDLHATAPGLCQRVDKVLSGTFTIKDVCRQADRIRGGFDRFEHRGKGLDPIDERDDVIARQQRTRRYALDQLCEQTERLIRGKGVFLRKKNQNTQVTSSGDRLPRHAWRWLAAAPD